MVKKTKKPKRRGRSSTAELLASNQKTRVRLPSPASGYNLWNPPPYEERKSPLAGLKIDPKAKFDEKKHARAMKIAQKELEKQFPWLYKKIHLTDEQWAAMMLRPICDH